MDKRTLGIILTIGTALCCGCPGILICLFGGVTAVTGGTYTTDLLGQTGVGQLPAGSGFGMLCLGLIFIAIPIVIGILMLRKPKAAVPVDIVPPAS
ncbi:MAG: hypothetical protein MUO35_04505 [Anaerolineales bacterium]|nr:hypothetical protein [Anaerolineales bacterium]